jgi:hypothetical protein
MPYSRSQVHGILCDACPITFQKFTVFCVTLALFPVTSSQYSVGCLPYPGHKFTVLCVMLALLQFISSRYSAILCDVCLIPGHKFTVCGVMHVLLEFISSRYSV